MRSMVEEAPGRSFNEFTSRRGGARRPLHRCAVPLPRFAGEDQKHHPFGSIRSEMILRWISLVPSKIVVSRASRQ